MGLNNPLFFSIYVFLGDCPLNLDYFRYFSSRLPKTLPVESTLPPHGEWILPPASTLFTSLSVERTQHGNLKRWNVPSIRSKNKTAVSGNALPVLGVKPKRGYVFWLFFKIDPCSDISFERSRRELSIDVAVHSSMLKNYRNTLYPRFSFIAKTGIDSIPQNGGFVFTVIGFRRKSELRGRVVQVT